MWNIQKLDEYGRENKWLEAMDGDEWMGEFGTQKGAIPKGMY